MTRRTMFAIVAALALSAVTGIRAQGTATGDPVDYVDPNIGGIGHVLQPTLPTVQLPHGMMRVAPLRTEGFLDKYLADKIEGFPVTITSHRISSAFSIMAAAGPRKVERMSIWSDYDHDNETTTPYEYAVVLEDHDIDASVTVTEHVACYTFAFRRPAEGHVILKAPHQGEVQIVDGTTIRMAETVEGVRCYAVAVFSKPCISSGTFLGSAISAGSAKCNGDDAGGFVDYSGPQSVDVKVGFSYISFDQAAANLAQEVPAWDFKAVRERGRRIWNETLRKIKVEGGSEKEKRIFYTALYRAHERMVDISEHGKYYSAYDKKIHNDNGSDFYVDDWLWDTYRCLHPLQLLIEPQRSLDMMRSYVRMYEQGGWMPSFPLFRGDHACMIGHHAASILTDAYLKGMRGFDVEKAYEGLKKNALEATMLPWANGPKTELEDVYFQKGFFPALPADTKEWVQEAHPFERRQSVAVTLEHSYDDWCVAQLAQALGKKSDYALFMQRAQNYRNVYNPATGFMSPKTADGKWVEPFDPKLSGGQGGRAYFAECNSWVYTWSVQHDVAGLINLMGGREKALDRLNQLFNEPLNTEKFFFIGQFPDASGLNGQFAMGDEPSFHIPYLYNYLGQPWKTQKRIRQLMKVWFDDDPLGICGDEDGGALSAWFAFSAMGFYPVTPGAPIYDIGSPIFTKITIDLGNGKQFVINAPNASAKNKYIQSATINGKSLTKPWFEHADIQNGGTLTLDMGPVANKQWGSGVQDAPPSMSVETASR